MSLGRILKTLVSWAIDNNQNAILFIYIIPFFSSEIPPYTTGGNVILEPTTSRRFGNLK